ncbi:acyl-CoA dehydrogenase family protein [Pseudomonas sp. Gutcm_11s]|uniref:acyl-CoA dehydrogenase family protein n=1 Tax=Pseudomonas sp. Gutcm_11s TaxID=3026088 RepID=UPI002360177C|nr:acyl-CoA dehydrogenase family protein [Pseudomonas sp. Gutcm_11s]MDD0843474.1 acyl-CoA dehydrogenase family protein [Pseudomonas sp. Gutcm_11s]
MTNNQPFDLNLGDDQRMTRESLQRFAQDVLRRHSREADEAAGVPADFYTRSLELGLTLMPIPEAQGGAGAARSPISNMLAIEDLAWGDMSLALGAVTPLAFVNTLLDQGSQAQQEKYLPRLAGENFVAASVALMEPRARFDASELRTTARRTGTGYVLNGEKSLVALGLSAELLLVVAQLQDEEGTAAFIVERDATGVSAVREETMGLKALELARIRFEEVQVEACVRLGEGEKAFDLQRLVDLARIGTCALAVGTCQAVLDYVVPYVNERKAFGEPIAQRQSVAFMVANMAIELEGMRLLTWRAASRAEQGLDFHKEAYLARVLCAEKAMEIGTNGIQLLGGHGFIREHLVELFYRNLRAIGLLEGAAII